MVIIVTAQAHVRPKNGFEALFFVKKLKAIVMSAEDAEGSGGS